MAQRTLKSLYEKWKAFADTDRGKRVLRITRLIFAAGIIALLVYQVSGIGWERVLRALPTHPVFYLLVIGMYLLLPATEAIIYSRIWKLRPLECLPIMIRKRVLNVDVVGYSGEVYLFAWAKERVAAPARALMGAIKDNLIVSSAASLAAAALLIGGLLLTGHIALDDFIDQPSPLYIVLGTLAATFIGAAVYRFRGFIFSLPRHILPILGAAHLGRFCLGYVLQVAAWWIVLPAASFQTWALLLVVFVVINRIPLLPSSDLVFVSAGAGLSPLLDVPVAPVVGMLLVRSAIDRLLNLLLFTSTVWYERQTVSTPTDSDVHLDGDEAARDEAGRGELPASLKT